MYKLITKSRRFLESEWNSFETVFDALDHARKIGFPGEEFEVFKSTSLSSSEGVKVASITVEEKMIG